MLALFASRYTKEDFVYLVDVLAKFDQSHRVQTHVKPVSTDMLAQMCSVC